MSARILPSIAGAPGGRELRAYADYTAVANELAALTPEQSQLPPLRVAVLRNFTVEPLIPVLAGEIAAAGFHPQFYVGGFDAVQADVLNPASALYAFEPRLRRARAVAGNAQPRADDALLVDAARRDRKRGRTRAAAPARDRRAR